MVAYAETRRASRCSLGLIARRGVSIRNGYWDANAGQFVDDPQPPHVMCDYTYMKDHMGNVLGLADAASGQAQLQTFDAFGNRIGAAILFQCASDHDNQTPAQPIARMQTGSMGWRGGEGSMTDLNGIDRSEDGVVVQPAYTGPSTGLIYMRARYYEPETRRFIQPDPVPYGPELVLAGQNNRWTYCANDPVNCSDPSGEFPFVIVIIGVVIGAAIGYYLGGWQGAIIGGVTGGLAAYLGALAFAESLLGGTAAGVGLGIGSQAVVQPGLGAGIWPAIMVNGQILVARFHCIAWELAGKSGVEQKYGFVIIDAAGKVIGWAYE